MAEISRRTLSQALCQVLRDMGYTNYQVADYLHMPRSEMSRVFNGEREFKAHHMVAIQDFVELPLAMLIAKAMKFYDGREAVEGAARAMLDGLTIETERLVDRRAMEKREQKRARLHAGGSVNDRQGSGKRNAAADQVTAA